MDSVERGVVAVAEQVGRVVGTVRARTDGWFGSTPADAQSGKDSSTPSDTNSVTASNKKAGSVRQARSGGVVDAPRKKHRKPIPSARGVKSNSRIAKMKTASTLRRRSRG
jgi:hypothetical protein